MKHRLTLTGFTLIELMVTCAILAVLASIAMPLTQVSAQRSREQELRSHLREIREALDAYKQAADEGRITRRMGDSGYPPTLETLVDGVADIKDPRHGMLFFLRNVPRDPLDPDTTKPATDTWGKRSYASTHDAPKEGDDVYDVYSKADGEGLDGIPYKEW